MVIGQLVCMWLTVIGTWQIGWARRIFSAFSTSSWRTTSVQRCRVCATSCRLSCCRWRKKSKNTATFDLTIPHARPRHLCCMLLLGIFKAARRALASSARPSSGRIFDWVDLIKLVWRLYLQTHLRPSVRPQNFLWLVRFEWNLIVCRGWWVLLNIVLRDLIQGQGHEVQS